MTFFDRLSESLQRLWEYVPALFGAAVVLTVGYFIAKLAQRGVTRLLRRVQLNDVLEKGGIGARDRVGAPVNPTRVLANVVFWFFLFVAMLLAAETLGIDYLGQAFSELVSYVPSVIAAVVIVILGLVLGDLVAALIGASTGALHGGPTLARVGKGGVVMLAVFMSLQELGVATDIVTTAFAIVFGAVALALALSFGLGNRDLAGEVTRAWYERWKAERDAIAREQAAEERDDQRQV
ncbi:MAG: mechanosensitive ion channel [Gemmatimonadales bacterium]|nr:mechanosensitive ion channel [Gemmatimonadales bacterium]